MKLLEAIFTRWYIFARLSSSSPNIQTVTNTNNNNNNTNDNNSFITVDQPQLDASTNAVLGSSPTLSSSQFTTVKRRFEKTNTTCIRSFSHGTHNNKHNNNNDNNNNSFYFSNLYVAKRRVHGTSVDNNNNNSEKKNNSLLGQILEERRKRKEQMKRMQSNESCSSKNYSFDENNNFKSLDNSNKHNTDHSYDHDDVPEWAKRVEAWRVTKHNHSNNKTKDNSKPITSSNYYYFHSEHSIKDDDRSGSSGGNSTSSISHLIDTNHKPTVITTTLKRNFSKDGSVDSSDITSTYIPLLYRTKLFDVAKNEARKEEEVTEKTRSSDSPPSSLPLMSLTTTANDLNNLSSATVTSITTTVSGHVMEKDTENINPNATMDAGAALSACLANSRLGETHTDHSMSTEVLKEEEETPDEYAAAAEERSGGETTSFTYPSDLLAFEDQEIPVDAAEEPSLLTVGEGDTEPLEIDMETVEESTDLIAYEEDHTVSLKSSSSSASPPSLGSSNDLDEDVTLDTASSETLPNESMNDTDYDHEAAEVDGDTTSTTAVRELIQYTNHESKVFLDPVQWLAQAPDTPLMSPTLAAAKLGHLRFSEQQYGVLVRQLQESNEVYREGQPRRPRVAKIEKEKKEEKEQVALTQKVETEHETTLEQVQAEMEENVELSAADVDEEHHNTTDENVQSDISEGTEAPITEYDLTSEDYNVSLPNTAADSDPHDDVDSDREDDCLVYNVFTRRVAKATSPSVRSLALIGIGVELENKELTVTDAKQLELFGSELRAGRVAWPASWTRGALYRQICHILKYGSSNTSDTATKEEAEADRLARVKDLLRLHHRQAQFRNQTGVISAAGAGQAAVERSLKHAIELVDEKLFSLSDLTEEQQAVVEEVLKGYHTYIGGGAGTGKSVLLRVIKQQLLREGLTVAVTATTGIAASHLGGCTLHHCFGINLQGEFTRRKELSGYDVIIIDEVSMLSRELFEQLEYQLRRANGVDLPFGGVQIILCGDFLQLGAVNAQPLITSRLFRRHFAMLKLQTVIRQISNPLYAQQLHVLRRGQIPEGLRNTVQFLTAEQIALEKAKERELRAKQAEALKQIVGTSVNNSNLMRSNNEEEIHRENVEATENSSSEEEVTASQLQQTATEDNHNNQNNGSSGSHYVEGAVNLLPTNREVMLTNLEQLAKLPGEVITFNPQLLSPTLAGGSQCWSPTYLLRILASSTSSSSSSFDFKRASALIEHYISSFFARARQNDSILPSWREHTLGQENIVLYHLFVDALALRVRLPADWEENDRSEFLRHVDAIDSFLESVGDSVAGLRVREVIPHGEGMHSERDEELLQHYAAHSSMANPLPLKLGAQVMLRANLAPGLVNGSLGTVVGFRTLCVENFPHYLVGSHANREDSLHSYRDFLRYEEGFAEAVVPEVDFGGGRIEPIPPLTFYVGGLANTHHYSLGITALPLSLAYAFTVHKVQGLTLVGRVHLELSKMWPCEHLLYVAMSRVRNPEQLSISSFHHSLVRAASDCVLFDDSLPSVYKVQIKPYFIAATWRRAPQRRKKILRRAQLDRLLRREEERKKRNDEERARDILLTMNSNEDNNSTMQK